MTDIKQLIVGKVNFEYYYDGQLWYRTEAGNFLFPVPVSDIGTAKFLAQDKAMLFMRYIRKWIKTIEDEQNNPT